MGAGFLLGPSRPLGLHAGRQAGRGRWPGGAAGRARRIEGPAPVRQCLRDDPPSHGPSVAWNNRRKSAGPRMRKGRRALCCRAVLAPLACQPEGRWPVPARNAADARSVGRLAGSLIPSGGPPCHALSPAGPAMPPCRRSAARRQGPAPMPIAPSLGRFTSRRALPISRGDPALGIDEERLPP